MPAFTLPDSITDQLRHLADQGETAWRETARLTETCLEQASHVPRTAVYQAVAYEIGAALRHAPDASKIVLAGLITEIAKITGT